MKRILPLALIALLAPLALADAPATVEIPRAVLEDKIRGGLLGQILGNLNGLPHEMKYIAEPGNVQTYTPALPDGARTDDDTDIEWVYLVEIQKSGRVLLSEPRIVELWKMHVNRAIWCSNLYARHLFDLGIEPPATGNPAVNPWAVFNIGGSFLAETWGLVAPGMPQTASRVGLHYTHVTIDAEPAQTTQFVTTMISTAFFESDMNKVLDAGLAAVDPQSVIHAIAADVRNWQKQHPNDWRECRRKIRDKYTHFGGEAMADKNGVELNTACTVAALLYGGGDFVTSMRHAFNFGYDADNNAATCGTVLGVIKGRKWMDGQGWNIKDVYRNTTRDRMPDDETITSYGDRLVDVARQVIMENGGGPVAEGGAFRIRLQQPANVEKLVSVEARREQLRQQWTKRIDLELAGDAAAAARAAYMAIALDEHARVMREKPEQWQRALAELKKSPLIREIRSAPQPLGPDLRKRAQAAGLLE